MPDYPDFGLGVEVLYCDNHLLVLNKPAGILTQPNETSSISLESLGKEWLARRFDKKGKVFLEAVHRIDRPVSGIVLFARTSKSLSRLQAAQRAHFFQKHYLALVEGEVQEEGQLEHYIVREDFFSRIVSKDNPQSKKCLLKFRALKKINEYTLLKVSLITGRYHQIRAQLSAYGHPILGDTKYGSHSFSDHLFLHHAELSAPHPVEMQLLTWNAPLPSFWPSFANAPSLCRDFP